MLMSSYILHTTHFGTSSSKVTLNDGPERVGDVIMTPGDLENLFQCPKI